MAEDAPQPKKLASKPRAAQSKPRSAKPKGPAVSTEAFENPSERPAVEPVEESTATTKVASAAQALKDGAEQLKQGAGATARNYVEDGKARAGGALDELAKLMSDAAGTVDEKVGAQYGQYARTAAEAVSGFSNSLKAKNVNDLIADATDFVKKSPAIAIGTAAAIGFVLVRLVQSGLNSDTNGKA